MQKYTKLNHTDVIMTMKSPITKFYLHEIKDQSFISNTRRKGKYSYENNISLI